MSPSAFRLLMVEDSPDDAELAIRELERAGMEPDAEVVWSRDELLRALRTGPWDIVLGDYTLPGFGGTEALAMVRDHDPDLPFIFVSGTIGEERAVAAMRAGARDYVLKGNLQRLPPVIERELREARHRRRRRRAEAELREKDERFRRVVESDMIGIVFWEASGTIVDANERFLEMLGHSREDLEARSLTLSSFAPGHDASAEPILPELAEETPGVPTEREYVRSDGTRLPVLVGSVAFPESPDSGVAFVLDISDQKRAEARARVATATVEAIVDASPIPIVSTDRSGRVRLWNRAAEEVFGWSREELLGQPIPIIPAEEVEVVRRDRMRILDEGVSVVGRPAERLRKDGSRVSVRVSFAPTVDADGVRDGIVALLEDVTESKELEAQLLQAQKLEAVGHLAGGVAHDFNNLLTVISSLVHFLLDELPDAGEAHDSLVEIQEAARSATMLTRQLLTFSRNELIETRIVEVDHVVAGVETMLHRLVGEDVVLTVESEPGVPSVECDPGQLEQVVVNLVVNARDAMPGGGELSVRTSAVELPEEGAAQSKLAPGEYAMITVRDSGTGVAPEVLDSIFDPFFTTKGPGKGTGLGLSTCVKIIEEAGGRIDVESEVGAGSAFRVYLPRAIGPTEADDDYDQPGVHRGTETILVVEDDERVRAVADRILSELGYTVIAVDAGPVALDELRRRPGEIDLVLSDVVLPGMGGREIAERARAMEPDLPVLFMSGYTEDVLLRQEISTRDSALLPKPFTPESMARKVREVLDGR